MRKLAVNYDARESEWRANPPLRPNSFLGATVGNTLVRMASEIGMNRKVWQKSQEAFGVDSLACGDSQKLDYH